jgi:hypothetical protein
MFWGCWGAGSDGFLDLGEGSDSPVGLELGLALGVAPVPQRTLWKGC